MISPDAYALKNFLTKTTDASSHPFRCERSWTPPCGREPALDTFITALQQDLMASQPAVIRNDLSKQERAAIKKL